MKLLTLLTSRSWVRWPGIAIGALIYTFSLNNFILTNHLAEGGFFGISILGYYKLHLPISITFLILNIPLLLLSSRALGRQFIILTLYGVVAVSVFAAITPFVVHPVGDRLLAALYGGVINGVGLGIIFRFGATTGGSDIVARLLNHQYGIPIGRVLFAIDVTVIGIIAVVFDLQTAMYSLVALFVGSRVIDAVLEGFSTSRALFIISDHAYVIAAHIQTALDRGTTLFKGAGGYTGRSKDILYCVVSREEIGQIQNIVTMHDPRAFIVISDVHDVWGEGFSSLKK